MSFLEWFLEALRQICPIPPFLDRSPILVPGNSHDFTFEGRNRQEFGLFEPRSVFNCDNELQFRQQPGGNTYPLPPLSPYEPLRLATAQFTTFVYGLARRRMWLVARAGFFGLSPEQMHRLDTVQRTPRYHHKDDCLRSTPAPTADSEERPSVRRVASIRHRLPRADRRWLDLFLEEGGNYAAVARRLGRGPESVRRRFYCLFLRIKEAV